MIKTNHKTEQTKETRSLLGVQPLHLPGLLPRGVRAARHLSQH